MDGLMKEGYLVNKIKKSKFRINIYLRVDKRRLNKNRIILTCSIMDKDWMNLKYWDYSSDNFKFIRIIL